MPEAPLNGNKKLYLAMVKTFEQVFLNDCLARLREGIELGDKEKIKTSCRKLKEQSACIFAGRIFYACCLMEQALVKEDHEKLMYTYPLVVEACVEFRIYSKEFIANCNNEQVFESKSPGDISIAIGFKMLYDE